MRAPADIGPAFLAAARAAPRLGPDEERQLFAAFRSGDPAALGRLVVANVRLAVRRAEELRGYGVPTEDLVQEGLVGLIEAAARYDPGRAVPFAGYAKWWIKSTTMDYVLRNWSIVRGSLRARQKVLFFHVRKLRARLMRDPSIDPAAVRSSVAAAIGVPEREVALMEARFIGDVHLNAPAPWDEDGEAEVGDRLTDGAPLLDDLAGSALDDDDQEHALQAALQDLDERERLVLEERWLADTVAPLDALGAFLGISAQSVKRIELRAFTKVQAAMVRHRAGMAQALAA